jgi:putative aldouronate transport system permease protein
LKTNNEIHPISLGLIHLCFIIFALICIIPFLAVISISFTSDKDIGQYGYRLIPKHINFDAYRVILNAPQQIIHAYLITIIITVVGTFFALLICSMLAYTISRNDYKYKKILTFYIFFTMLFSGGLVPWYILIVKYLHLKDTIMALILPYLVVQWFVMLLRTFFQKISISLIESAKLDGASEWRIFLTIVLPLSKPALATVGLMLSLQYWNDWWLSLLYIDSNLNIMPLQFLLYRTMSNIAFINANIDKFSSLQNIQFPAESARMAMVVLAAGPMLFIFPFFQKYFVKGLTIGSLKE